MRAGSNRFTTPDKGADHRVGGIEVDSGLADSSPMRVVGIERIAFALGKISPFDTLSGEAREEIASYCRFLRFESNQQIIGYHDHTTDVFLIVSGKVQVSIFSMLGKEISYRDLGDGDMFGELAAIDGCQRSANVTARTDTVVVTMPRAVFREVIYRHPTVAEALLLRLAGLVRLYSQRLYELRTLDVPNRVRAELVRLAEDSVGDDNTATICPVPSHATIANRICTRREAVSREMASLRRRGMIERRDDELRILDYRALVDMVMSVTGE